MHYKCIIFAFLSYTFEHIACRTQQGFFMGQIFRNHNQWHCRKIFCWFNFYGKQVMQSEHTHCSTDSSWMNRGREWALWTWQLSLWNSLKILQHQHVVKPQDMHMDLTLYVYPWLNSCRSSSNTKNVKIPLPSAKNTLCRAHMALMQILPGCIPQLLC